MSPSGHFVRSPDGVNLFVREWGDPEKPAILLIHGQAQCHLSFLRQTDSNLASKYRLVAFDLRGHGASDKPLEPGRYNNGRVWADDVKSVIDALQLRKPIVAGWSLGGRVIRQYLIHYGDAALGGINFLSTRPIEHPSVIGPGSQAMADSLKLDFEGRLRAEIDFLRACFEKPPAERDFPLFVAFNALFPRAARDALGAWSTDPDITAEALRRVTVPTLITHGRKDRLVLPKAAEMTAACIPYAQLSWYDDCGHSPFYEDASRYNRELDAFAAEASTPD